MNLTFRKRQIISNACVFDVAVCLTDGASIKHSWNESFGKVPVDDRWQHRLSRQRLLLQHHLFSVDDSSNSSINLITSTSWSNSGSNIMLTESRCYV
jgi:hypothetical protein